MTRALRGRRAHRRRRQADHPDRRADQSAGAQRDHRGRAGRRCRPRLCRGGPGGQEPRRPDRQGDRRNLQPDRQHAACDRRNRSAPSRRSARPSSASATSPPRSRRRSSSRRGATQNIAASVRAAASGTADVAVNVRHAAEGAQRDRRDLKPDVCLRAGASGESLHLKARGREVPRRRARRLRLVSSRTTLTHRPDAVAVISAAARSGCTASAISSPAG